MRKDVNYHGVDLPNKWKILRDQWRFFLWAAYTALGGIMFGFDGLISNQSLALPAFQRQYGIPYPGLPSGYLIPARWQSVWNGTSIAGGIVGELISGYLQNIIGRKPLILIGTIFTCVGVGITQAALNWKIWMAGRIITTFGFCIVYTMSPVWIGENARPETRGFFLCFMDFSTTFGQFIVVLVSRGTETLDGKWSYELLVVLEYVFIFILFVVWPFFPESPYWLVKAGNDQKARNSLIRIHGSKDQEFIDVEMTRLKNNVKLSDELEASHHHTGVPYLQLFLPPNLRRTLTAMLPAAAQQFIGSAFTFGYSTYFFSLIGVTNAFTVTCILFGVTMASCLVGFYIVERIGRRTIIIPSMVFLTLIMLSIGIAGTRPIKDKAAQTAIVVFIFIFQIFYNWSIGVCGLALASEIGSLPLRSQTQGMVAFTQAGFGWVILFTVPYMVNPDAGDLGGKVGFVFFGLGAVVTVLLFFFAPETKGLTWDEIDYCFSEKISPRRFQETIRALREERAAEEAQNAGKPKATTETKEIVPEISRV